MLLEFLLCDRRMFDVCKRVKKCLQNVIKLHFINKHFVCKLSNGPKTADKRGYNGFYE